MTVRLSALCSK